MNIVTPEQIIESWKQAYRKANHQEPPQLIFTGGAFQVQIPNGLSYNAQQIHNMTQTLMDRSEGLRGGRR